ncbi:menaquinone biosynthesis protein [Alkalihalobacterium chitinilyticum]|uniref:Chorismate dehydratase n=1 Tax=Alkalihalobacterium chitinilyticum TaxID=2980103 RepID=A0ABT5VBU1_9BACI|nr:menaquinone biosynthesis protein [Alkalihalobacterium chitinilyticum]MDE5411928.1 menaquinone biosynthesis protein [Alkalihalobacterium chitinilyticum]
MTLIVGEISYTNILPIFYYLDREKLSDLDCRFVPQIPAELNRGMANGAVDVGGISSFAYGENFDRYTLLPNLSVSAYSRVGSLFLFSKVPIEELNEKSVALTSSSATTIHLLKIILERFYEFSVEYDVMKPNFESMLETHDACLLIGDDAIKTVWNKSDRYYMYDIGQLWYEHTGLPMTYAVFAVRNEVLQTETEKLSVLYEQLISSKRKSIDINYLPMIDSIRNNFGGTQLFWEQYFKGLSYDLNDQMLKGLNYYYQLAYDLGYLKKKVQTISLWSAFDHSHSM